MTTIRLEAVRLTEIEDDDGRWRRAFSGRIAGGEYVAVCDELLAVEMAGRTCTCGLGEAAARQTRIAKQRSWRR